MKEEKNNLSNKMDWIENYLAKHEHEELAVQHFVVYLLSFSALNQKIDTAHAKLTGISPNSK